MEREHKESARADSTDKAPGGAAVPVPAAKRVAFEIPEGTAQSTCRSCHAPGYWVITKNGKRLLVDPDGAPHFATCPDAHHWRRSR